MGTPGHKSAWMGGWLHGDQPAPPTCPARDGPRTEADQDRVPTSVRPVRRTPTDVPQSSCPAVLSSEYGRPPECRQRHQRLAGMNDDSRMKLRNLGGILSVALLTAGGISLFVVAIV